MSGSTKVRKIAYYICKCIYEIIWQLNGRNRSYYKLFIWFNSALKTNTNVSFLPCSVSDICASTLRWSMYRISSFVRWMSTFLVGLYYLLEQYAPGRRDGYCYNWMQTLSAELDGLTGSRSEERFQYSALESPRDNAVLIVKLSRRISYIRCSRLSEYGNKIRTWK
jgi:hypothetical protein